MLEVPKFSGEELVTVRQHDTEQDTFALQRIIDRK